MKWYRINIDYLWNKTDKNALETSSPAGKDKATAIERFYKEMSTRPRCCDDKTKPAKIDLTEYIYSKKTNQTRENIIFRIMPGTSGAPCLLVDNRYQIYLDNGTIYDTKFAKDIPGYIFSIRDKVLQEVKQ